MSLPETTRLTAARRDLLVIGGLLVLAALLLFPAIGVAPLQRAEIYFMDAARAMVERGDWLVPYYRGEPFFDKPALTYWLMAFSFEHFGFSAVAARLVPALATLLTILATLWLGSLTVGRRAAAAGALVLVTTLSFIGFGRVAMSDALLALWSTLSVALGVAAYSGSGAWAVPLLGAALGLGFLTKGPIALLLPGLGLLWLMRTRRGERVPVTTARVLIALGLFVLLGLGWFALVARRLGSGPLEYFFLRENLQRFAAATYDTDQPFWFYLTTYLGQGAPWSLFLPLAGARLLRGGATSTTARGARFLLGWLGLMLIPLSLSRGKLDYYLLPLYPAAALLIGHYFVELDAPWKTLDRAWARVAGLVSASVLLLSLGLVAIIPEDWLPPAGTLRLVSLGAIAVALLLAAASVKPQPWRVLASLALAASVVLLTLALVFLPAFRAGQPNARIVADVAREKTFEPALRLTLCDDPVRVQRDVLFETRIPVDERCDVYAPIASRLPFLILLSQEQWSLTHTPGLRHIATYTYLPAAAYGLRALLEGIVPSRVGLFANFTTRDPVAELKRKRERRQAIRGLEAEQAQAAAAAGLTAEREAP